MCQWQYHSGSWQPWTALSILLGLVICLFDFYSSPNWKELSRSRLVQFRFSFAVVFEMLIHSKYYSLVIRAGYILLQNQLDVFGHVYRGHGSVPFHLSILVVSNASLLSSWDLKDWCCKAMFKNWEGFAKQMRLNRGSVCGRTKSHRNSGWQGGSVKIIIVPRHSLFGCYLLNQSSVLNQLCRRKLWQLKE